MHYNDDSALDVGNPSQDSPVDVHSSSDSCAALSSLRQRPSWNGRWTADERREINGRSRRTCRPHAQLRLKEKKTKKWSKKTVTILNEGRMSPSFSIIGSGGLAQQLNKYYLIVSIGK